MDVTVWIMKTEYKFLAIGLSAALLTTACADSRHEVIMHVGIDRLVDLKDPIHLWKNGEETKLTIDHCYILRGARLILEGENVIYKNDETGGSLCDDGTAIDMTVEEAKHQNIMYNAFASRRKEVTNEVRNMSGLEATYRPADENMVDIVNPAPIEQFYTAIDYELLEYGDSCLAQGEVKKIGQLSTGQAVMYIKNPHQHGYECPSGTLYLIPSGTLYAAPATQ